MTTKAIFIAKLGAGTDLLNAGSTFTSTHGSDLIGIVGHGMETGDGPVRFVAGGGVLPTGISAATDYYIIKVDADSFKLATSKALALAGTVVATTADGTANATRLMHSTVQMLANSLEEVLNQLTRYGYRVNHPDDNKIKFWAAATRGVSPIEPA